MKFNRIFLFVMVSIALVSSRAMAADTGTISFSGLITDTTCDLDINGAGMDATVVLPTVSADSLNVVKTGGRTQFTLSLSGCSGSLTTAKAFFEAGSIVNATGRLKNTNSTGASNVSLQLSYGQDIISVGDQSQIDSSNGYVDVSSGSAVLPYFVEYYAEGAVTAGAVTSQVTYNLIYR